MPRNHAKDDKTLMSAVASFLTIGTKIFVSDCAVGSVSAH